MTDPKLADLSTGPAGEPAYQRFERMPVRPGDALFVIVIAGAAALFAWFVTTL